jgi:hypothetical protein
MIQSVTDFILSASTDCDFIFTNNKELRRGADAVDVMSGMALGQGSVQRDSRPERRPAVCLLNAAGPPFCQRYHRQACGQAETAWGSIESVSIAATGCLANWLAFSVA